MRLLIIISSLLFASFVHAASLAGTYVIENRHGRIVATLEVKGERLTGAIDFAGKSELKLMGAARGNTASGTISSKDGAGLFEATVQGNILNLVISQQDGPNQKAPKLPLQFQRVGTETGAGVPALPHDGSGGDPRLVGNWGYQDMIVSGNASFAADEHMAFRADGSYLYGKGGTVAGGKDWSFDGGKSGKVEHGRWHAQEGILYVMFRGGEWMRVGKYGMTDDGKTMRITYKRGNRKLWNRQ